MSESMKIGTVSPRACPKCSGEMYWRPGRGEFPKQVCGKFPKCDGTVGAPRGAAIKAWKSRETPAPESTPAPVVPSVESTPAPAPSISTTAEFEGVASAGIGGALWAALGPIVAHEIEKRARQIAAEEIAKKGGGVSKIEWTVNGKEFAAVEGVTHRALGECLRRIKAGLKNILLVGPAGSGKSQLAHDAARALKLSYSSVSCTSGMPEWHLTGRSTPNLTTGETTYQVSDFVNAYENGGVVLLDELDAADPNTLLVVNSALANGRLPLPHRTEKPFAERHADFYLFAAANTWGTGASRQYVGRNQLDASTLSRFAGAIVETDYDRDLETALVGDARILSRVWAVRDSVGKNSIRRVVGTRELLAVARLVNAGETLDWAMDALTTGWTPDEKSRAGLN